MEAKCEEIVAFSTWKCHFHRMIMKEVGTSLSTNSLKNSLKEQGVNL